MADKSKMVAEFNRKFAEIKGKFQKNSSITEADIIELDSILSEVVLSTEQDNEFLSIFPKYTKNLMNLQILWYLWGEKKQEK